MRTTAASISPSYRKRYRTLWSSVGISV
ncbi:hypothetical protein PSPO01_09144 [Paraphaeosphaeria sporulosa]